MFLQGKKKGAHTTDKVRREGTNEEIKEHDQEDKD